MAFFKNTVELACTPETAFAFLCNTANRVKLTPPDAALELIEAPAVLELGSHSTWKLKRFGMSQSIELEVTVCEPPTRLVEEQRQGPLRRWVQSMTCRSTAAGTAVEDVIEFEPPGGMLGLLVTASKIHEKLAESFAWRDRRLRELLSK
jgi:ligand-binding SRPBCC domain-containing protein